MRAADAGLVALSLAGIAGLALAAEHLAPPDVALAELPAWDGHAVAVEALVARGFPAGAGAQALRLADGTGSAGAFWPRTEPVEGARVRAEGVVERARGAWQLRVRALEVLAPAEAPWDVADAARLAPALAGREVAVLGTLRLAEEGPRLEGEGARLALQAPRHAELAGLDGARVLARGVVRFDAGEAAYRLEAREVRQG